MTFSAYSGEIMCFRLQPVSCSITDNKVKSDYSYKNIEVSKYFDILQNLITEHARKALDIVFLSRGAKYFVSQRSNEKSLGVKNGHQREVLYGPGIFSKCHVIFHFEIHCNKPL